MATPGARSTPRRCPVASASAMASSAAVSVRGRDRQRCADGTGPPADVGTREPLGEGLDPGPRVGDVVEGSRREGLADAQDGVGHVGPDIGGPTRERLQARAAEAVDSAGDAPASVSA